MCKVHRTSHNLDYPLNVKVFNYFLRLWCHKANRVTFAKFKITNIKCKKEIKTWNQKLTQIISKNSRLSPRLNVRILLDNQYTSYLTILPSQKRELSLSITYLSPKIKRNNWIVCYHPHLTKISHCNSLGKLPVIQSVTSTRVNEHLCVFLSHSKILKWLKFVIVNLTWTNLHMFNIKLSVYMVGNAYPKITFSY